MGHRFSAPPKSRNQLWVGDITEHWTGEGKLSLCTLKDVYSNRIVGYSIHPGCRPITSIVGALLRLVESGQFRSRMFVHARKPHGMVGSMSRVGAAGDSAAMEPFFALLQKNVLDRRRWATRHDLRMAIATWIERPTTAADVRTPSAD
ncbi:hypothetical protein SAMN05421879_10174 [Ornithinimicrobium cerasi]|uniref:Integrase core domain-containing protein n=1 Tax=Ornithinimicrobium cerasi TaxID=2248773 RepID=A0A285VAS8_9MICO|nr:hypothetical protein SAMN05421879_10174 [Ornithinimicrobium cerasi]